jgi:hypothetical protein
MNEKELRSLWRFWKSRLLEASTGGKYKGLVVERAGRTLDENETRIKSTSTQIERTSTLTSSVKVVDQPRNGMIFHACKQQNVSPVI